MKNYNIGILAHVDAGKTTLSESMLYLSGKLRTQGRVDHKNAFLDYDGQERERGITIYFKQADLNWKDCCFTLLDTPGHVDFSAEMERVLSILDYAILVINAQNGVQAHTRTIWKLLEQYRVPVFLFINKMDISYLSKEELMLNITKQLSTSCIDFLQEDAICKEQLALCSEPLLEEYVATGSMARESIADAIAKREVIPCVFGSALKNEQVMELLDLLQCYAREKQYPHTFGAKVFKVTHDRDGTRLVHVKITGGSIKVKTKLDDVNKIDQIRCYCGNKYQLMEEAKAGMVVTFCGCSTLSAGMGLGFEKNKSQQLHAYMSYQLQLPKTCDSATMMKHLKQLMEEEPQLEVSYQKQNDSIHIKLMGEVQKEILIHVIKERFGVEVEIGEGTVVYKETIVDTVEGVGHFEPLRHYAEVHLLLEPLPMGSGIVLDTYCGEEVLAKNWQRLILSHLKEREHPGVLCGMSITDMKITLLSGRAHLKHTEGGDFREATYRALRHGLKKSGCRLLEPYYDYTLLVPNESVSRAIFDMEKLCATYRIENQDMEFTTFQGSAPVSTMQSYAQEVLSYTKGRGTLLLNAAGYQPCHNEAEVIAAFAYDSERDIENPTGSIFCSHGSGFYVRWQEVENYMHMKAVWKPKESEGYQPLRLQEVDEKELERIFERTYGKRKTRLSSKTLAESEIKKQEYQFHKKKRCLLVDGYNVIHSFETLKELAQENLDAARHRLIDMLSSYQGYRQCLLILVFDAYQVKDGIGSCYDNGSIHIVYTKEAQTADSYIEKATHELAKEYEVSVATSDGMEQLVVMTQNAMRISARELEKEMMMMQKQGIKDYEERQSKAGNRPLEKLREYHE